MASKLVIKIVDGQWYAVQNGRHLTANQTATLIANGASYQFENNQKGEK